MFKNLENAIHENHMTINSAAAAMGMSESSLRYKINKGSFGVTEAFKIRNILFPKYDLYYLFEPDTDTETS